MKFERVKGNVPVFSEDYEGRDRTIFGQETQSDNINDQFTEEYKTGWGIVGKNEFPTLQDFNALGYTLNNLISYLYQSGVAEYSDSADYYKGSVVQYEGALYIALVDDPTAKPSRVSNEWLQLRDIKDNRFDGMLQIHADNTSGTGLFLFDNKGAVRGQMMFSNAGLQLAQQVDGKGYTYTLPKRSGEFGLKADIDKKRDQDDFDFERAGEYGGINIISRVAEIPVMYVTNQNGKMHFVGRDFNKNNIFNIRMPAKDGTVALTSDAAALGQLQYTEWVALGGGIGNVVADATRHAMQRVPDNSVICKAHQRGSGTNSEARVSYRRIIRTGN